MKWLLALIAAELLWLCRLTITERRQIVPLGQQLLDKVTEMDTKVDSVLEFIRQLQADGTIPADVAAAIFAKIQGSEDKLDAALAPNPNPAP